jgi:hypothetical protein
MQAPDIKDLFFFGGLGAAGVGLWLIYPPAALIVVGGIVFAVGLLWYMRGANKDGTS